MKSFNEKVAVITGAGSGLGRALALDLYQAGARLALCDLNMGGLDETRTLAGDKFERISLHKADVSSLEQMESVAKEVLAQYGQADILINNAGITLTPKPFEDISHAQFEQVLNVNMWGVYNGTRAFLSHLKERPEAAIVNISSLAGLVGLYGYAPYAMSKFAVRGLSETLQSELVGTSVHVLVVHPGGVKTNIIRNAPNLNEEQRESAHAAFSRMALLEPEQVARKILRAVEKKRYRLILGADAKLVNGIRQVFSRKFPVIVQAIFSQAKFQ